MGERRVCVIKDWFKPTFPPFRKVRNAHGRFCASPLPPSVVSQITLMGLSIIVAW